MPLKLSLGELASVSSAPNEISAALSIPSHWRKGQLLDVKRYADGYRLSMLGEDEPFVSFDSTTDCQNFVSQWYTPEAGR